MLVCLSKYDFHSHSQSVICLSVCFVASAVRFVIVSQDLPWKVLAPGDDNSESINTFKVYCPDYTVLHCNSIFIQEKPTCIIIFHTVQ